MSNISCKFRSKGCRICICKAVVYNIDSNLGLHQIKFSGIIFSEILEALKARVDCNTQVVDCYKMININFLTVDDEKIILKASAI